VCGLPAEEIIRFARACQPDLPCSFRVLIQRIAEEENRLRFALQATGNGRRGVDRIDQQPPARARVGRPPGAESQPAEPPPALAGCCIMGAAAAIPDLHAIYNLGARSTRQRCAQNMRFEKSIAVT
jgi:hypothetical protein